MLMLHRESLYAANPNEHEERDITDLFLRKNRPHGTLGHHKLRFDVAKNRFLPVDRFHKSEIETTQTMKTSKCV